VTYAYKGQSNVIIFCISLGCEISFLDDFKMKFELENQLTEIRGIQINSVAKY
jgi:hypothetical protein